MKKALLFVLALSLSSPATLRGQTGELLLFGGRNHETFLGCLNCSRFDSGSVCSRFGDYGSRFSDTSIWSRFGTYGSRFSNDSPWGQFASNPPVVVDREGNSYGYLTLSRTHSQRTRIRGLVDLLDYFRQGVDLSEVRDLFCEG